MGNKDRRRLKRVNNTTGWEKKGSAEIRIPAINPVLFIPPHIQRLFPLPDSPSPSPASPPLTHVPPGCLYSHHPALSPGEKFNLCIFIVVAHTNPAPHESFISLSPSLSLSLSPSLSLSLSLSLLASRHICIRGWIQLPR